MTFPRDRKKPHPKIQTLAEPHKHDRKKHLEAKAAGPEQGCPHVSRAPDMWQGTCNRAVPKPQKPFYLEDLKMRTPMEPLDFQA